MIVIMIIMNKTSDTEIRKYNISSYSLVKYNSMLSAINSTASGITTYIGLYPSRFTIIGYTDCGGGLAIIKSSRTARERLWSKSAIVKMIRPRVKLDLILRYISRYEIRSTSSSTMLPAVI